MAASNKHPQRQRQISDGSIQMAASNNRPQRQRLISDGSIQMAASNNRPQRQSQISEGSTPYSCTELYDALKSLLNIVNCCSCHKPMQTAITCIKGHCVCPACKEDSKNHCPSCKSCVPDVEPAVLNTIIKLLPRSCHLAERGCDVVVLPGSSDHESYCRFRLTDCKMRNCGWSGEARLLLPHLERLHGQEMILSAAQAKVFTNFDTSVERKGIEVIVVYNNIFWQHTRVRDQQLMQVYQYVPMTKPSWQFTVTVSMTNSKTNYSDTFLVHTEASDPEQLFNDVHKFCLPKPIAESFKCSEHCTHYSFKIHNDKS